MSRESGYAISDAERLAIELKHLRLTLKNYELKILSQQEEIRGLRELQAMSRKIVQPPEFDPAKNRYQNVPPRFGGSNG